MKLLYVLGSFFPAQSGGPNNTVYWIAKSLVKEDVDVTVASLSDGLTAEMQNQYSIEPNKKNKISGISAYYFTYAFNRYLSYRFYWWLIKNIKKYDLVNLNSYFFPITWLSAFICVIYKVPFSIAPRGELESNAMVYNSKVKKVLISSFLKWLFSASRFVLVTSNQEKRFTEKYFNSNKAFEVIPNYQDLQESCPPKVEELCNKKNILYLGRIHPKKNIETLIKAFSEDIEKKVTPGKLIIAGAGDESYLKELVVLAGDCRNIVFAGHVTGKIKQRLLREAKVLVLPSHSENYGNVVTESLQYGTPVIASRFTPWESIQKYGCGYWIDNDAKSMKIAIQKIFEKTDDDYFKMCQKSYDFVHEYCDVNKHSISIKNLFQAYI